MRVLLISANTETINMPVLPLGMAFVARAVADAGHEVSQINLMAEPEALKTFPETIQKVKPDIIGISVRNIDDQVSLQPRFLLEPVKSIIVKCRQNSEAKIVLGGAGYSIFPEEVLSYLGADMGIQGEGEQSFIILLNRIEKNKELLNIPGLHYPELGITNPPDTLGNIDQNLYPQPGRHIFSLEKTSEKIVWLPFQTRRGCPLNCSYCSSPLIEGRTTRKRSIESVIHALSEFSSGGFNHFFFVDNTFNLPPGYAKELCEHIMNNHLNITWRCILYPGKVDKELVEIMAPSGCIEVSLGMESGSDAMLKKMNKQYRASDVSYASDLLQKAGIRRMGFLLLGGPGETRQSVLESLEFVDSLALDMVKVTVGIRIYPETELAIHAKQVGKISPNDNLLLPKFYIENEMETWLRQTVSEWMRDRSNWIY